VRLLQLVMLALLATAVKGDIFATASVSLFQLSPSKLLYHSDTSCEAVLSTIPSSAECSLGVDYGHVSLSLIDNGSGCDGCSPIFGAFNQATLGFTDLITFYGPVGGTAVVIWDVFSSEESALISLVRDLPSFITFDVPYVVSLELDGSSGANGNVSNGGAADTQINGFQVLSPINPDCDVFSPDTSCGPPIDVSIHTASGFLYGGHTPEPSSLLLLATAALALLLVARSGRIEHNFGLRRMRRDR
jgi:hypothetical protein